MRWYQVDSDTPNDPKIKRLLRDAAEPGTQLPGPATTMGHLFLVWCFVANHGAQPGMGVKADGTPLDLDDMAFDAMFPTAGHLRRFLTDMAERGLVGKDEWEQGIVFLPAMKARADAYAKSKGRGEPGPSGPGRGKSGPSGHRRAPAGEKGPIHHTTGQDTTPEDHDDQPAPAVPDLLNDAGEDNVDALVRIWNTERQPGPTVRDVTPQRRARYQKALKARPDLSDWRLVIAWLNGQKWCNAAGTGDHPSWRADLDWLAKPGNLARYYDKAQADRPFMQRRDGAAAGLEGRNAAKGRTGFKRGEFAAALGEGGSDEKVH